MSREKDKTNGYDPGIGTRFKLPTKRIINKDGSFNVVKEGARFRLNDAYLFFIQPDLVPIHPAHLGWVHHGQSPLRLPLCFTWRGCVQHGIEKATSRIVF